MWPAQPQAGIHYWDTHTHALSRSLSLSLAHTHTVSTVHPLATTRGSVGNSPHTYYVCTRTHTETKHVHTYWKTQAGTQGTHTHTHCYHVCTALMLLSNLKSIQENKNSHNEKYTYLTQLHTVHLIIYFVLFFQCFLTFPSLLWRCFTPGSTDLFSNGNLLKLTFCCKADTFPLRLLHLKEQQWKTPQMKCFKSNIW